MTAPSPDLSHLPESWVDDRGVTLTRAGVERARDRLAAADAQRADPDRAAARRAFVDRLNARP